MENAATINPTEVADKQALQAQLNGLLSDLLVLNLKVKNFHWNLEGTSFIVWHQWLDEAASHLQDEADSLAERLRMRGETARGSLVSIRHNEAFADGCLLRSESQILPQLKTDYQALIITIREALELSTQHADHGTADMLTGTLRMAEKDLWYLSASTPY